MFGLQFVFLRRIWLHNWMLSGEEVNGESDEIPPPPSPPCTCGKNLGLSSGEFAPVGEGRNHALKIMVITKIR